MAKELDKKRAAARRKPEIPEEHAWRHLLAVQDGLNLLLEQIYDHDKGKMFQYRYTDVFASSGEPTPSTKFGMTLTMPESQIIDELAKNIFKIVTDDKRSEKLSTETVASTDLGGDSGEDKRSIIQSGSVQELF